MEKKITKDIYSDCVELTQTKHKYQSLKDALCDRMQVDNDTLLQLLTDSYEDLERVTALLIGDILRSEGRFDEAEKYFTDAAKEGIDKAWCELGILYMMQGLSDKAKEMFLKEPDDRSLYNLGVLLAMEGDYCSAMTALIKAADSIKMKRFCLNAMKVIQDKVLIAKRGRKK